MSNRLNFAFLLLIFVLATKAFAEDVTPLEDAWEDIKETPETIVEQLPVAKEETGKWLLKTTVKSGSKFAGADDFKVLRGGQHYATDLTKHDTVTGALKGAFEHQAAGQAVKGSLKSTCHPLAIAGQVAAPVALEGYRQLKEEKTIDVKRMGQAIKPHQVAGSTLGVIGGDALGAAAQSALSAFGGPAGKTAGLFVRPLITWSGYYLGRNAGKSLEEGKPSLKSAFADTMREINPAQFVSSVVCATAGGMIGQALIPIPVVGYIAGYAVGGVLGTMIGNVIGKHGPTGFLNKKLISWLHRKADDLEGKKERDRREAVEVNTDGTIETAPQSLVKEHEKPKISLSLLALSPVTR